MEDGRFIIDKEVNQELHTLNIDADHIPVLFAIREEEFMGNKSSGNKRWLVSSTASQRKLICCFEQEGGRIRINGVFDASKEALEKIEYLKNLGNR